MVKNKNLYTRLYSALGKEFTPKNPYSKLMAATYRLRGPVRESKWIFDNSTRPPTLHE